MATKGKKKTAVAVNKPSEKTIQKHIEKLEKLVKKGKGKLPTYSWLNANGYFRSYEIMRMFPARFNHITNTRAYAR